jgi:hypothetical protein
MERDLEDACAAIPSLAGSIDSDARSFVTRQAKNGRLAQPVQLAESLARRYLIREVATYGYLASLGWRVDVYLGRELPTLARIMDGTIPAPSEHLARRINISLKRKDAP